jgi:hypothetical protein
MTFTSIIHAIFHEWLRFHVCRFFFLSGNDWMECDMCRKNCSWDKRTATAACSNIPFLLTLHVEQWELRDKDQEMPIRDWLEYWIGIWITNDRVDARRVSLVDGEFPPAKTSRTSINQETFLIVKIRRSKNFSHSHAQAYRFLSRNLPNQASIYSNFNMKE